MRLRSEKSCAVVLLEQDTRLKVNNTYEEHLRKNNMILLNCEHNTFDFSELNATLIAHIDRDIIKDYLRFLNQDLTHVPVWNRNHAPFIAKQCRTPDVFQEAARHSLLASTEPCEVERTRSLLFTVLSIFLPSKQFIPLLMHMLRTNISDCVYHLIQSDLSKNWNLNSVASCLCLSPSLLKKKLKNEDTSYSQIIAECRMRHALTLLLTNNCNISQISQLCGYSSTSYFISVFKSFYGVTPLTWVSQHKEQALAE